MSRVLHIHPVDNVVNALVDLAVGQEVSLLNRKIRVCSSVPVGHKMSIREIPRGQPVIKYGKTIGYAKGNIRIGEHVHVHNVRDPVSDWKRQYGSPGDGGS